MTCGRSRPKPLRWLVPGITPSDLASKDSVLQSRKCQDSGLALLTLLTGICSHDTPAKQPRRLQRWSSRSSENFHCSIVKYNITSAAVFRPSCWNWKWHPGCRTRLSYPVTKISYQHIDWCSCLLAHCTQSDKCLPPFCCLKELLLLAVTISEARLCKAKHCYHGHPSHIWADKPWKHLDCKAIASIAYHTGILKHEVASLSDEDSIQLVATNLTFLHSNLASNAFQISVQSQAICCTVVHPCAGKRETSALRADTWASATGDITGVKA